MHCQSCGLPIAPTTQVCPRCGQPVVPDFQPGQGVSSRGNFPSTEQFAWQNNGVANQQISPVQGNPYQQNPAHQQSQPNNAQQAQNPPPTAFNPGPPPMAHSEPLQRQPGAPGFPSGQMQGGYSNNPYTTSDLGRPQGSNLPLGYAQTMAPTQSGPIQPQAVPGSSFPSAPLPSGPMRLSAFSNGPFSSTPVQSSPDQSQPLPGGMFPPAPLSSGPIQPQNFNGGAFPSAPPQSGPIQLQPPAGPPFPSTPLQSGPILPQTLNSGAFPFAPSQSGPVQPSAFQSGPFLANSMQSSPVQPSPFQSGSFPNAAGNGSAAFQAPPGYVQQQSPVGGLRSASVIQPAKKPSMRKVFIAVATGFIIALLVAVGYLAFLQKPISSQSTTSAKPLVQTHPKKLPSLPAITASDPQALYTQAIGREAMSSDPLSAQSDNDWETVNSPGSCSFDGNTLHAVNSSADARATMCLANATKYKNVAFQAQIVVLKGDTDGLIMRADNKGQQMYLFSITTTGMYTLAVTNGQNGSLAHILAGGTNPAIKQGQNQTNQLTLIARDNTLYLYVNQKFVTKVSDTTAASGSVGLFVGNSQGDVSEARFTNAKMWSV